MAGCTILSSSNGYYQIKGVWFNQKLYQLWADPLDEMMPDMIRNDFNDAVLDAPIRTLAIGTFSEVHSIYKQLRQTMEAQAKLDGYVATTIMKEEMP